MKVRQGRHNKQIIYIQLGDEPSDDDELLAVFMDPMRAHLSMEILNGDSPALEHEPQPTYRMERKS